MALDTDRPDPFGSWLGIVFAALLLCGGAFMAISAPQLRLFVANGPGSGFLPLILGSALAIVSGLYLVQRVMDLRAAGLSSLPAPQDDAVDPPPEAGLQRSAAIVVSLVLLAALLEAGGFQLVMFAFLLFHLKVLGRQGWILSLVVAAVGSFGVFALFSGVLRVTLPRADIPFLEDLGL